MRLAWKLTAPAVAAATALLTFVSGADASPDRGRPHSGTVTVAQRPALDAGLPRLRVSLPEIPYGETFSDEHLLIGFGCTGGNQSPEVRRRGTPAGTKSFLITIFDVDAPANSGFWHWSAWNIPATAHSLPAGAGTAGGPGLPAPSVNVVMRDHALAVGYPTVPYGRCPLLGGRVRPVSLARPRALGADAFDAQPRGGGGDWPRGAQGSHGHPHSAPRLLPPGVLTHRRRSVDRWTELLKWPPYWTRLSARGPAH